MGSFRSAFSETTTLRFANAAIAVKHLVEQPRDGLGMRARIGQKNGLVRQWARRGTRPRQPADQRYQSAYLFGAICPKISDLGRRLPGPRPWTSKWESGAAPHRQRTGWKAPSVII
jgi:hypothetical protein